jgi:serine/threonine protein kinase
LNYFKGIVKGYEAMRLKSYIHRDLKPANILIKNGTCKLADFGFSKMYFSGYI